MKSKEYNKIDNTYFLIEKKTIKVCKENNVDFYDYIGVFKTLLINYIKDKNHIEVVKSLDFNDKIGTRAILNKAVFSSKKDEINLAIKKIKDSKDKLYSWLDKTKDPYFFILNPIYNYGAGIDYNSYFKKTYGYNKERCTGTQNLDIAFDYAIYLMKY